MTGKNYKSLDVWKQAMELADLCYDLTENFPQRELFGLAAQIRKSAVSVPSNIAEGHERNSTKEYIQFLGIARGSIAELETQLMIAEKRQLGKDFAPAYLLCDKINMMLWKLVASLNSKINNISRISNLESPISEAKA